MYREKFKNKIVVMMILIILTSSVLFYPLFLNVDLYTVEASSSWQQTSDKDFNNGTLENTTIVGKGDEAELQVDLPELSPWTMKFPLKRPEVRYQHALASIYGTDKVLLFGGYGNWHVYDDTWVYDLSENDWTKKTLITKPPGRYQHAMASIYGDDKVVLFGGYDDVKLLNDTWVYDLSENKWSKIITSVNPPPRSRHAMASIWGTDSVVIFSGHAGTSWKADTWIFDLKMNSWTEKTQIVKPTARYDHAMTSIYGDDKVLLFGGWIGGYSHETYVYDLSDNSWTQKVQVYEPSARSGHALASIYASDTILLFGGYYWTSNHHWYDETWTYDLNDNIWTKRIINNIPSERYSYMASVYGTDKVVLFGGYGTYNYYNDTWIYKHFLPTKNGSYVSAPYDTGSNSAFNTLSWYGDAPINTSISYQLRTGATKLDLSSKPFIGPDGKLESYYNQSPAEIWIGHYGDRWIQYKVYFRIKNFTTIIPSLEDVTICYNCLPNTIVLSPINGSKLTNNKPVFKWTFIDFDSNQQCAFQVLIDDDYNFNSIDYDSHKQNSIKNHWQFPAGTNYTDLTDGTWYWKVRTMDEDGAWTEYNTPWVLTIDTKIPSSSTTTPYNNGYYNNLNTISGIASDHTNGSGLNRVEINIKQLSDNHYWNGSSWVPLITWLLAEGTANWTYDSSAIPWRSGSKYSIQSRAFDNAANIELTSAESVFTIDMDRPTSTIESPKNNIWLNNLDTISGSSADIGGSGISKIEISLQCTFANRFWHGDGWGSEEHWLLANGTEKWVYDTSTVQLGNYNQYIIRSRATDHAGNVGPSEQFITIKFDAHPPELLSIKINNDDEFTTSISVELSLQAVDNGSGVCHMAFSTDNIQWLPWEPFNDTRTFLLPGGDKEKIIYLKVRDLAGNIAESVFDTIILDITPPKDLSIAINDNAQYTNSLFVSLSLFATDAGSGLSEMSFSYDKITWSDWEPFEFIKSLILPVGDGEKTIYFKVRDTAGNIARFIFDTIILDTLPPYSLSILINNGTSITNSTQVLLQLNALDDTSGLNQISLSTDGNNWSAWKAYEKKKLYYLVSGDGEKTIYFKIKDQAGNIAAPVFAIIYLNTSTSTLEETQSNQPSSESNMEFWYFLLFIIIIIFLILITGLIIIINRKKRSIQELLKSGPLTIKPDGLISPSVSIEQIPEAQSLPELPIGKPVDIIQEPLPSPSPTPVPLLVKSTQAAEGEKDITQQAASTPEQIQVFLPSDEQENGEKIEKEIIEKKEN